ncbi:hypothetical protein SAMN04487785_12237 [Dyella jiangningensis]|nr:hypothetical protein BDW41_11837 [Dyella sp. AtDHG13]SDL47621.1 hypothetical protein SAMN04487785_12237 [Dyella jiangningensis]
MSAVLVSLRPKLPHRHPRVGGDPVTFGGELVVMEKALDSRLRGNDGEGNVRSREHPTFTPFSELTPTLSSLLKAAAIHGCSPRAPKGRESKAARGTP